MKFAVVLFFLIYVGEEVNYAGWIPTYTKVRGITDTQRAGLSASVFWVAITLGRALAIPLATKFPVHQQLTTLTNFAVGVMGSCLVLLWLGLDVIAVFLGSFLFGLSLSAMYPLLVTIPGSFGY